MHNRKLAPDNFLNQKGNTHTIELNIEQARNIVKAIYQLLLDTPNKDLFLHRDKIAEEFNICEKCGADLVREPKSDFYNCPVCLPQTNPFRNVVLKTL